MLTQRGGRLRCLLDCGRRFPPSGERNNTLNYYGKHIRLHHPIAGQRSGHRIAVAQLRQAVCVVRLSSIHLVDQLSLLRRARLRSVRCGSRNRVVGSRRPTSGGAQRQRAQLSGEWRTFVDTGNPRSRSGDRSNHSLRTGLSRAVGSHKRSIAGGIPYAIGPSR